jgi:hypothetical protein
MSGKSFFSFLSLLFFFSCNDADKNAAVSESENDLDAARNFINAALQGDFKKARLYMLTDTANEQYISAFERVRLKPEDQEGLKSASIQIHEVLQPFDTTTIVIYSNSYMKNQDTLKVLKTGGKWLVDLKYLFEHDTDTLQLNKRDTLQ